METPDPISDGKRCFLPPRTEILRLDLSKLARQSSRQPIADRAAESGRVVRHLLAIVREHRASARRIGSPLDRESLEAVLEALRIESRGGDPRHLLEHSDPVAAWLRRALFEDLLEVPSNVLYTTQVDDETIRYEAMEAGFWRECLRALGERVAKG